jgi:hypothetical protein
VQTLDEQLPAARSPCTPHRRPWQQVWGTPGLLDPSVSLTAYRLVQEALTNTVKHAGPGTAARVGLAWAPEQLAITVQKEAPVSGRKSHAAAALSTGYGLVGLRERVQSVGGTLHAGRPAPDSLSRLFYRLQPHHPPAHTCIPNRRKSSTDTPPPSRSPRTGPFRAVAACGSCLASSSSVCWLVRAALVSPGVFKARDRWTRRRTEGIPEQAPSGKVNYMTTKYENGRFSNLYLSPIVRSGSLDPDAPARRRSSAPAARQHAWSMFNSFVLLVICTLMVSEGPGRVLAGPAAASPHSAGTSVSAVTGARSVGPVRLGRPAGNLLLGFYRRCSVTRKTTLRNICRSTAEALMARCEDADNFTEYKRCRGSAYPEKGCKVTGDFDKYMRCVATPGCGCPSQPSWPPCGCLPPTVPKGLWELLFPDKEKPAGR